MATAVPANHALLEARAAAEATGGRVVQARGDRVARGITTDSRSVTSGCAFVALRGARHDGHTYLNAAIDAGAVLVLVEYGRAPNDTTRADVVEVADTLAALGAVARAHLRAWKGANPEARVVAITGSAGKTTTKELCAAILRSVGRCHATRGNLNNRIGVPAVALGVETSTRYAVLEMGMSERGELAALAAIAEPDVGVITNIGLSHAGGVGGSVDDVAREKGSLFEAVREGGVVVANADDSAVVHELRRATAARVVTFGAGAGAGYRLVLRQPVGADGSIVEVRRPDGETARFQLPMAGNAAAIDFVAALAAAEAAAGGRIDNAHLESALRTISPIPGRMHMRRLRGGVLLIDDTYNASPAAMRAALATLGEAARGRRIAVLGEMKELGSTASREHDLLGKVVADASVALLVSCGGLADAIARDAAPRGVEVVFARDSEEAALIAVDRVRSGDAVLVKASRSVGAERVVEALVRARGEEMPDAL
jgi:UDP-N-acetylmuramoyl-tripeptide--D-alanyl-D-alanine ligase